MRVESMEEKLEYLEALFVKYGAVPTGLDAEKRRRFGDRVIYERDGSYFRVGTAVFDGKDFLMISCIDKQKFAEVGVLEDIDALSADCPKERMERAVRYALGVEPYPDVYPEKSSD